MDFLRVKLTAVKNAMLIIACIYICQPFYFVGVTKLNQALFYLVALFPVAVMLQKRTVSLSRKKIYFIFGAMTYLFFIFVILAVNPGSDLTYMMDFFRGIVNMLALFSLVMICEGNRKKSELGIDPLCMFVYSAIGYVMGTVCFIIFPSVKEMWLKCIVLYDSTELIHVPEYATRIGFAGFSGFNVALYVNMALLGAVYLYIDKKINTRKALFLFFWLLLGSLLYGRIGTVAAIVITVLFALYMMWRLDFRFFKTLVKATALAGIILYLFYKLYPEGKDFLYWIAEPIYRYIKIGMLGSDSTDSLLDFYRNFRPTFGQMLHGTGKWKNPDGSYFGYTDVEFMRYIYFGGIFFTVLAYLLFAYYIYLVWKKGRGFELLLFLTLCILFEVKGDPTLAIMKFLIPFAYYKAEGHDGGRLAQEASG